MKKTIVQCDFDGTVTLKDVSYLILDAYADGWRDLLEEYRAGRLTVGVFNTRAFTMVKADRQTLLDLVFQPGAFEIRPGFTDLLAYCQRKGFDFEIVSNGVDFYIEEILRRMGLEGLRFHAATSRFHNKGLEVEYIGPDGHAVDDAFKESFTRHYADRGYRVIYIGNGESDIFPARVADHFFATDDLLALCHKTKLPCLPFKDFNDVIRGLEGLG